MCTKFEFYLLEIEKFHETQIVAITQAHAAEVDAMKNEYEEELKKAKVSCLSCCIQFESRLSPLLYSV